MASETTPEHIQGILIASNVATALSITGELWIFLAFARTWSLWSYSGRMVLCLTISYFIHGISNILQNFEDRITGQTDALCKADGFLRSLGVVSSFIWAYRIAKAAYSAMIDTSFRSRNESYLINLLKGFAIPLVIAAFPLFNIDGLTYGYVNLRCGIMALDTTGTLPPPGINLTKTLGFVILSDFVPTMIASTSTVYYSFRATQISAEYKESLGISPMRLLTYPIGLSLLWSPTVLYLLMTYFGGHYSFGLDVFRIFTSRCAGFLHAIVYGIQSRRLFKIDQMRRNSELSNHSDFRLSLESMNNLDEKFDRKSYAM